MLIGYQTRQFFDRLGFFLDLEGGAQTPAVADALVGLGEHCEEVRVLGSYRSAS